MYRDGTDVSRSADADATVVDHCIDESVISVVIVLHRFHQELETITVRTDSHDRRRRRHQDGVKSDIGDQNCRTTWIQPQCSRKQHVTSLGGLETRLSEMILAVEDIRKTIVMMRSTFFEGDADSCMKQWHFVTENKSSRRTASLTRIWMDSTRSRNHCRDKYAQTADM